MDTAVIVFFIIILVITARITISIKFIYDVFNNIGELKIKLFNFLTIFAVKIKISGPFIKLIKKGEKDKLVKIDLEDQNIKLITDIQKNIINKIYLIAFNSKVVYGNEDCFLTTKVIGLLQILNAFMFYKVSDFEKDATINMQAFPLFAQNKLEISMNFKFIVSIFDLIYAVIKAILEGRIFYGTQRSKFKK